LQYEFVIILIHWCIGICNFFLRFLSFAIMSSVYVNSEKNKRMLEYKGLLHTQEIIYNEKVCWKSSESKKLKCKGRVHVVNEKTVKFIKHNNHVKNVSKIEVRFENT